MIAAVHSALSGLATATTRLNDVAADIAQGSAQLASAISAGVPSDSPSLPLPGSALGGSVTIFSDNTSLVSSLVDLKEAEFLYTASVKLLGTVGDMQERLVDITR